MAMCAKPTISSRSIWKHRFKTAHPASKKLPTDNCFFAWKAIPHPSWPVKIGMGIAGFLAIFVAIPIIEVVVVLIIPLISN